MQNNDKFPVNPPLLDALATIETRILRIGYAEATGAKEVRDIFDFAFELRQMLLAYGFTTETELSEPSLVSEFELEEKIIEVMMEIPDEDAL